MFRFEVLGFCYEDAKTQCLDGLDDLSRLRAFVAREADLLTHDKAARISRH
jgi:hypothetical protein